MVEVDYSLYGYIPTASICILFIALFGLSTIVHVIQALYFRLWWMLPTVGLAGLGEVIGWIGRYWSSQSVNKLDPYLMQICATIIAPTPLVAANFVIFGVLIKNVGVQYSRLSPGWYTLVFVTADIVALVVQAIGGASASRAAQTDGDPTSGGNIMLGGIVFQLVAITFYVALAVEFLVRFVKRAPVRRLKSPTPSLDESTSPARLDRNIKLMFFGLAFSTLCIFIRAIYRTIELADGWEGRILRTQLYFNVLDGAMIVLAIYTLNIFHPGILIKEIIPSRGPVDDVETPRKSAEAGYEPTMTAVKPA